MAVGPPVAAQDAPDVRPAILSVDASRAALVESEPRQAGTANVRPQDKTARKWEIEGHIGGSFLSNPTSGTAQLPPVGASYQVPAPPFPPGLPGAREYPPSREVSSWYFGDGSVLFNDARRAFGFFSSVPITALDPALTRAGSERGGGLLLGFRVARALNDRLSAEFSFDASLARVRMRDDTRAAIETTSTSFEQAFDSIFAFASVDSNVTIHREGGGQLNATGALTVNLLTGHRWTPYATIGGGVVSSVGDMPRATLVGKYQVVDFLEETGTIFVDDTDTVSVRYEMNPAPILLLGGGFKFDLSPRTGIRGDVRFGIASNGSRVAIDTEASHADVSFSSLTLIGPNSSAVFSSPGSPRQRSLSGPALSGFETFTGTRYQVDTAITIGYFTRF
jgi:hypothetical protein